MVPKLRFSNYVYVTVSIESLYDFISTNSFSRDNLNYESGTVKNIHYGDILTDFQTHFYVNRERVPFINENINLNKYSDFNFCKPGDIIFADASEDYDGIGKHIEIISVSESDILAGLHTIHARLISDKVEIGFMSYQLQSWNMRFQIMRIAQGTKVFGISAKRLGKLSANIPPKNEQQKIALFLSSVDEKIYQLDKKKTLLETYKRGIMQKIFSQELRFKDENGEEFPDWEEIKMGDLFSDKVMSCETQDQMLSVTINSGIRLFEEIGKKDNSNSDKSKYKLVNIGDIVYNTMRAWQGAIGVSKYDGFVSPAYTVLEPKPNAYNLYFGYFFKMKSVIKIFERHSQGLTSDQWSMKYNSFRTIKFFVPCFEEQRKISSFISILDKKIEITSTQLEKTREFKKGLLQQMFV